jgi:ADP-ribosylglycohydrolase
MVLDTTPHGRKQRADESLLGLSVGDAFGQQIFGIGVREWCLENKQPPPPPWEYTDDTEMAIAICDVLERCGFVDQDALAQEFAKRYDLNPWRGYGEGAINLLKDIFEGGDWRSLSQGLFGGVGSLGNGGAMRAPPLGAWFAEDDDAVVEQARRSAQVTHAHPEGIDGAIAVAVAAAWICRRRVGLEEGDGTSMLDCVCLKLPPGKLRDGVERAFQTPLSAWEYEVAEALGCGDRITAADTVPFCLWMAAAHQENWRDAVWKTMLVGGDIDTNCAIVGGLVACRVGKEGIPDVWVRSSERPKRRLPVD